MNWLLINIIRIIHIFLVCFVVIVPFTNSVPLLLLHSVTMPFLMLHWLLNDNTCALSTTEMYLREQMSDTVDRKKECFTCNIFDTLYDFNKDYDRFSMLIYLITTLLWLLSVRKLTVFCEETNYSFYELMMR